MTIHHRITTTAAVILSLGAAGAPTAAARPADDPAVTANQAPTVVYSQPDREVIPVSSPATYGIAAAASGITRPAANMPSASRPGVRVQTPHSGFDWGDAGIGAAGGVALLTMGLVGALLIFHRGPRRSRQDAALPS